MYMSPLAAAKRSAPAAATTAKPSLGSATTVAIAAAAALLASLFLAPPPSAFHVLSSVFDIRHLDDALAALYLWPNAEMAAEGNLVGWCLTSECMDQAFVVRVTELTLLGGSRSSEALGFSVPDITVGDYSLLTFVLSVLISGVLVNLAMLLSDLIARLLFTRFDASKCSLPSVLPWPDPAGNSKPFDVPVPDASEEQLASFLAFRGVALPATDAARREAAAREAISYMAELFDRKHDDWCYRHYALREKGLAFPYRALFMDDWNFYGETSAHLRPVGNGQIIFALHHAMEGFMPLLYFWTHNPSYFFFSMYADMGVEAYDTLAMIYRRWTGRDHTLTRHHPAVDHILTPHHLFGVFFETLALMGGPGISKTFMFHVEASAHASGVFILAAIVMHQTPAQSWPRFLYRFQKCVVAAIVACRVIWWIPVAAGSLRLAYAYSGDFPAWLAPYGIRGLGHSFPLLSPVFLFSLLLIGFYTHFNADQLQYNLKLLRKAAARVRAANEAEKPAPAKHAPAKLASPAQRKSPRLAAASA